LLRFQNHMDAALPTPLPHCTKHCIYDSLGKG
jgi:hypothetical protein